MLHLTYVGLTDFLKHIYRKYEFSSRKKFPEPQEVFIIICICICNTMGRSEIWDKFHEL